MKYKYNIILSTTTSNAVTYKKYNNKKVNNLAKKPFHDRTKTL